MQWFQTARSQNIPLSGETVKQKAKQYAEQLQITDFECSNGWLDRFKERHDLTFKKVCGESNSVDSDSNSMSDWKSKLQTLLEEFKLDDIYNADESGLFYRMMPDKTLEYKTVKCHGGKMSKERVTVLVCANMSGTDKVPLLVIGKSRNPRCFKNVNTLPLAYDANKTAWMTSEIFTSWVKKFDRKVTSQGRKVALIVDNCPAHPDIMGLASTSLVFLPPNTTSHTQPMDQGVIRNLKCHYRKLVIQKKLRAIDESSDLQISVLDALYMIKRAWRAVTPATVANCFRHAGFELQNQTEAAIDDPEDDIPLAALKKLTPGITFEDYASVDDDLPICAELTDDEIISNVLAHRESTMTEQEEPDDEMDQPKQHKTILDALNGVDAAVDFVHQSGMGPDSERVLAHLNDAATLFTRWYLRGTNCVQAPITKFFGQ